MEGHRGRKAVGSAEEGDSRVERAFRACLERSRKEPASQPLIIVIPSITTPGLSRHTFPWTPGAPLRLPRRFFSFTRSIVAALYFRFLPYFGILRWSTSGSTNHLSGNGSQIALLRSPLGLQGGGLPTQAHGPVTASHRMTRACPHVEPAPHTSIHDGASSTTSPPIAAPPSPWPPRDCPCAPTTVCRPASTPRPASPPTARLPPAKTASGSNPAC